MIIIKTFKPTSPGYRQRTIVKKCFSKFSFKPLCFKIKKFSGKNNTGKITVKNRGGGNKALFKKIVFFQPKNISFIVGTEYCSYRNTWLLQMVYTSGFIGYVIGCNTNSPGSWNYYNFKTRFCIGNMMQLKHIPVGIPIFNVFSKSQFSFFARAAGTFCKILDQSYARKKALLLLPSGKTQFFPYNWFATIGISSNIFNSETVLGKAGVARKKGARPNVRGVAMNPIDHPHGGGSGKTSGGRPSVSAHGRLTKCKVKTRKQKRDMT